MTRRVGLLAVLLLSCSSGCGQSFGAMLYHMNLFPKPKIEAEFILTPGPILILLDDDDELLTWPNARSLLTDQIAEQLELAEVNAAAIRSHHIEDVRQRDPTFAKRSISELGEIFAVEQILWIQVRDFFASTHLEDTNKPARFILRVKVFDPHADSKSQLRLWPAQREGHFVSVEAGAVELRDSRTIEEVSRYLVEQAADMVAKLFYEHEEELPRA